MQPRDLENLAQELNQPVDALGLLAHALRRRTPAGEAEIILDGIELGLSQMRRQHASLLDVVRTERCLAEMVNVEFPLMPLLEKLVLQTSRLAHENGVLLSVVPTRVHVRGDPAALEVILRNLLVNALFFARGGRVLLGCRRRDETVQIQVWDNGVGIAPENQSIIFEPLTKLKGDGDDLVPGLGIGLTLVRDLAAALGLDLGLRSEQSRGSMFSVALPVARR